jgi:hypothetical protein
MIDKNVITKAKNKTKMSKKQYAVGYCLAKVWENKCKNLGFKSECYVYFKK